MPEVCKISGHMLELLWGYMLGEPAVTLTLTLTLTLPLTLTLTLTLNPNQERDRLAQLSAQLAQERWEI